MKKPYLDNILDASAHFSKNSGIWRISLPMLLLNKIMLDRMEVLTLSNFGLIRSETDVLATLFFNNKILSPTDLYEGMLLSSGGMTKILRKLEEKGLISRIPSQTDKRSMLVQLETKGEILIEKALLAVTEYEAKFFDVLDEQEKSVLEKALKKLAYTSLVDEK